MGAIAPAAVIGAWLLAIGGSLVLAAAHALTPLLDRIPERHQRWLTSFAAGLGLTYVVLYLLFQLTQKGARQLHALLPLAAEPLETLFLVLLLAMVGAVTLQLRLQQSPDSRDDHAGVGGFFVAYNVLAGAGLAEEVIVAGPGLAFYVLALALHLMFNDHHLDHLCHAAHTRAWRLTLAAAPVVGATLALALPTPDGLRYGLLTLVAGMTIINVLRQELPSPETFHPAGFLAGVAVYAGLMLASWRL